MGRIRGIVAGFVAGLAFAAGAVLLMRNSSDGPAGPSADLTALNEQVQRLEVSVSKLSHLMAAQATGSATAAAAAPTPGADADQPIPVPPLMPQQVQAIAAADAMVDRGLQSGQWTRVQAAELHAALAELDGEEGARILARVSAAINRDELQIELP